MSKQFVVQISNSIKDKYMKTQVHVKFIGSDDKLKTTLKNINQEFDDPNNLVAKMTIEFLSKTLIKYKEVSEQKRIKLSKDYDAYIDSFYNISTMYQLYDEFPVLKRLKGINRVLLLCCLCQGLKLGFINITSVVALSASGTIEGMDDMESMKKLVEYYEHIGFHQEFPDILSEGIDNFDVTMTATVKELIDNCKQTDISSELWSLIPVKTCKDICSK